MTKLPKRKLVDKFVGQPKPTEIIKPLNNNQRLAMNAFKENDILFLTGPAGTGKTTIAMGLALQEILQHRRQKIIVSRPVVEAGDYLGYLPGTFTDKIAPYLVPCFDAIKKVTNTRGFDKDLIKSSIEIAPLAYMRGRSFCDTVAILDEGSNCTYSQIKLFLTRLDQNSKMIITADPNQSDLLGTPAISEIIESLKGITGISIVEFQTSDIVRHKLVGEIIRRLR